jgi:hypothetical protein
MHRGHGHRQQECLGKTKSVKLWGVNPGLRQKWDGGIHGVSQGGEAYVMWPSPMCGKAHDGQCRW